MRPIEKLDTKNNDNSNKHLNVRSMPDPFEIYDLAFGASDTSQSFVYVPDIRDGDGELIPPQLYEHDQSIYRDNKCLLKTVRSFFNNHNSIFFNFFFSFPSWNLRPNSRNNSNYNRKEGDENGARIYQLMLNSMQILPINDITEISLPDSSQKRKIEETPAKTTKKRNTKVMQARNSVAGPSTRSSKTTNIAMDTSK